MDNTWQKIFSGQFVFTVVTAWAFAYAVVAKLLTPEQVYLIITLVVTFYFNKPQSGGSNATKDNSTPNNSTVPGAGSSTDSQPKP